jgi:hypothetical protein
MNSNLVDYVVSVNTVAPSTAGIAFAGASAIHYGAIF